MKDFKGTKKILFDTTGIMEDVCVTKCPFGENGNVGSVWCQKCKYFVSVNYENNTVECKKQSTKH